MVAADPSGFAPPRSFALSGFERSLPGLAPNTLSARLKMFEAQGVVDTRLYQSHPPRYEYFLTDKGQALLPVLKALYAWGDQHG